MTVSRYFTKRRKFLPKHLSLVYTFHNAYRVIHIMTIRLSLNSKILTFVQTQGIMKSRPFRFPLAFRRAPTARRKFCSFANILTNAVVCRCAKRKPDGRDFRLTFRNFSLETKNKLMNNHPRTPC